MNYLASREFALEQDELDPLGSYRDKFYFPDFGRANSVYLTGHSLGL